MNVISMDRNFVIFCDENEVLWHFGNITEEFIDQCSNFLRGVNNIGYELFKEGIATIKLTPETRGGNSPEEIFVVSLGNKFFFIISDLLTTIRLVEFSGLPDEPKEQMCSMLSGQVSVLFSNLYNRLRDKDVEKVFHESLREAGIKGDLSQYVTKDRCSVGQLSFRELCLLHYFFREKVEMMIAGKIIDPWVIMTRKAGIPIEFKYKAPANELLIAGYLAAIREFTNTLFDSNPCKITFGGSSITTLDVINGKIYIIYMVAWNYLLAEPEFLLEWQKVKQEVIDDVNKAFQEFVAKKLAQRFQEALLDYPLPDMLYILGNFIHIEKALPLLLIGKEKFREIFEKEDRKEYYGLKKD
jgi:hypothetical protein